MKFWLVDSLDVTRIINNSFLIPKLKLFKDKFKFLFNPRKDEMSYDSILEYLKALSNIYFNSSKKEKTKLLNHAIQVTKLHRKSIIRAIKNGNLISKRGKGIKKHRILYPKDTLLPHIEYIWHSMERISAKRMKEALKE